MSRNTTWTSSRDAQWENFAPTMFYDGQGFMVLKSLGVVSLPELDGSSVCVQQGTTTELNLQDYINQNDLDISILTFEDFAASEAAYASAQCDAMTADRSGLVSIRSGLADPNAHIILREVISEEPLGPVVPHGDEQWFDIVKMVMSVLIYAQAYGVTSDTVPTTPTGNSAVDRIFGLEGSFGQESVGLSPTVAQNVIRAVGNYGEIYDRQTVTSRPWAWNDAAAVTLFGPTPHASIAPGAARSTPLHCASRLPCCCATGPGHSRQVWA